MYVKDFDGWNTIKKYTDAKQRVAQIKEGEVWWSAAGINVGSEIDGKNKAYSRPVVILKKLGRYEFLAVPLTSKYHDGSWYVHFIFKGKDEYAAVYQIRMMSVFRLYDCIGELSESDYNKIREGVLNII